MEIRVYQGKNDANMYVVSNENNYIVIDPCVSPEDNGVSKYIEGKNLEAIFITHGHYDHFTEIKKWFNFNKTIYLHRNAVSKLQNPTLNGSAYFDVNLSVNIPIGLSKFVDDGDVISLLGTKIEVFKFDGHTDCGLAFQIENKFFSGDFIFTNGNIGRCDLPTSNFIEMQKSLDRLKSFSSNLVIMPGHGEAFVLGHFWDLFIK